MFSVKVSRGWTPGVMKWWPHALKKTTIRKIGLRLTIFGNGSYSLMRAMMSQTSLLFLFAMFSFCADIDGTYSWNKGLWDDETCWIHFWKYSPALFWHKHFSRVFFFSFLQTKMNFPWHFFSLKNFQELLNIYGKLLSFHVVTRLEWHRRNISTYLWQKGWEWNENRKWNLLFWNMNLV